MKLILLNERFAICRLPADAEVPSMSGGPLVSITRTARELSVVCLESEVPDVARVEKGWRCFQVQGPLDFGLTGILASLSGALADAGVSLFAISTFDTDYILVRDAESAWGALVAAGHSVESL